MFWKKKSIDFDGDDVKNIRKYSIKVLLPIVDYYADWYAERGITLPAGFEQDPTGWTEVLRKIQRAFVLVSDEESLGGEICKALGSGRLNDVEKLEKEIQEGFELFGKYLNLLVDNKYSEK